MGEEAMGTATKTLDERLGEAAIACVHRNNNDAASLLLDAKTELERLAQFEAAYHEWSKKTEWVQERTDWPFPALGKHRADVMRLYIEHLEKSATP